MLKLLLISLLVITYSVCPKDGYAQRADAPCVTQANEKKLQGEARTSFLKTCEQNAKIGCETVADGNNLIGTEKTSFVAKCVKGTIGK
jgi:hypothetical protein